MIAYVQGLTGDRTIVHFRDGFSSSTTLGSILGSLDSGINETDDSRTSSQQNIIIMYYTHK